jgi:hypothetical protein
LRRDRGRFRGASAKQEAATQGESKARAPAHAQGTRTGARDRGQRREDQASEEFVAAVRRVDAGRRVIAPEPAQAALRPARSSGPRRRARARQRRLVGDGGSPGRNQNPLIDKMQTMA